MNCTLELARLARDAALARIEHARASEANNPRRIELAWAAENRAVACMADLYREHQAAIDAKLRGDAHWRL